MVMMMELVLGVFGSRQSGHCQAECLPIIDSMQFARLRVFPISDSMKISRLRVI